MPEYVITYRLLERTWYYREQMGGPNDGADMFCEDVAGAERFPSLMDAACTAHAMMQQEGGWQFGVMPWSWVKPSGPGVEPR